MTRRVPGRILLIALLGMAVVAIGGAANAFWGGLGGGTGDGTTATTVAVTLSPGTPTATLYPGGQADVVLTVTNTNASAVRIGSLALDTGQGTGGFAVDAGHAGCDVSALSFTTQSNGGAGWNVPGRVGAVNGTLSVTLANALAMGVNAANACQGASSTVYLVAGP